MKNNPFGARISLTRPQYSAQPHIVFLRHQAPRRTRHESCLIVAQLSLQVLMVESDYKFAIAVMSDENAEKLKLLSAVRGVGAVSIDVEKLVSIMKHGI